MRSNWTPVGNHRTFEATFNGQKFRVEKRSRHFRRWRVFKWNPSLVKWVDCAGFIELSAAQAFAETEAQR